MDHAHRTLTSRSFAAVAALPEEHQAAALACVEAGRTEALDAPDALVVTLEAGADAAAIERAIGMLRGVCAVHPTQAARVIDAAHEVAEQVCRALGHRGTADEIQLALDALAMRGSP